MELANAVIIFGFLGILIWGFLYGFNDGTEK